MVNEQSVLEPLKVYCFEYLRHLFSHKLMRILNKQEKNLKLLSTLQSYLSLFLSTGICIYMAYVDTGEIAITIMTKTVELSIYFLYIFKRACAIVSYLDSIREIDSSVADILQHHNFPRCNYK